MTYWVLGNPQEVIHLLARKIIFGTYIRMMDDEILDENLIDGEAEKFEIEEDEEESY